MPVTDLAVIIVYTAGVVGLGSAFFRRGRTPRDFTAARGRLPMWAVGLSLFGTYLSSNTFLGIPGKAFASNWNSFVFSLSLPLAAWLAARFFVPFYRHAADISAYTHLERQFGRWARTYASVCYLLTQLARIGSILFGVALALGALTGWPPVVIIVGTGALVTVYTLLGGIEAVIWTDAVQSVILSLGAVIAIVLLLRGMPEGPGQLFDIALAADKFQLGSLDLDFSASTLWVVLLYGVFINLNNFGIDQSFVQRYHTARSEPEARRSVWLATLLYVPISALFFFIGTGLFAYYEARSDDRVALEKAVEERWSDAEAGSDKEKSRSATTEELGDKAFPHFIVHALPSGLSGLVLAALFAAAMSSIDTSLNSSATVILSDLYRWIRPDPSGREAMAVLYASTLAVGLLATATAVAMMGVKSILDAWWTLSGIFAGGMLGLFLLGVAVRRADRAAAIAGVAVGVLVIFWMTFSPRLPEGSLLRSPFHGNMIAVIGTLSIFLVGVLVTRVRSTRE